MKYAFYCSHSMSKRDGIGSCKRICENRSSPGTQVDLGCNCCYNEATIILIVGVFITKYLIVVDMQNDFTIGSLGSVHAAAIIPNVLAKVKAFPGKVIFTRDTHGDGCIFEDLTKENFLPTFVAHGL